MGWEYIERSLSDPRARQKWQLWGGWWSSMSIMNHVVASKPLVKPSETYWPFMAWVIDEYVKNCLVYYHFQPSQLHYRGITVQRRGITFPWSNLQVHWIGPVPKSLRGNTYLLKVICAVIRWIECLLASNDSQNHSLAGEPCLWSVGPALFYRCRDRDPFYSSCDDNAMAIARNWKKILRATWFVSLVKYNTQIHCC